MSFQYFEDKTYSKDLWALSLDDLGLSQKLISKLKRFGINSSKKLIKNFQRKKLKFLSHEENQQIADIFDDLGVEPKS